MLNSYNITSTTLAVGQAIPFTNDSVKVCGDGITHTEGSTTFTIRHPGIYLIGFSGRAAGIGVITMSLYNNSEPVPGATTSSNSSSDTDIQSLNFMTLLRVPRSCCVVDNKAVLTVVNDGIASTLSSADFTIIKVK